jgi:uncharacterized protein YbbC (DUF1343 family)
MAALAQTVAPDWLAGCSLRPCWFAPTFHKHLGRLCSGVQIHTDNRHYRHGAFRPYRIAALILKAVRLEYPTYPIWRDFHYEYERERLAFDLLSGGTFLRQWVDDTDAVPGDLEAHLAPDEAAWLERRGFLLYR